MQYFSDVVQDRNGNVVTNASVLIKNYPALTTATIYDSTGASIANPITTSSDGEYTFYCVPGAYTIVTSKSGITTKTRSNVVIGTPGSVINVKEAPYGAVGDGTTDDTAAIQAAIDSGAKVINGVPGETYLLSASGLQFTSLTGVSFIGNGATLKFNAAATQVMTSGGSTQLLMTSCTNCEISNWIITGNAKATNAIGLTGCTECRVIKNRITDCGTNALIFTVGNTRCIYRENVLYSAIGSARGLWVGNLNSSSEPELDSLVIGNITRNNPASGICGTMQGGRIEANHSVSNSGAGIVQGGLSGVVSRSVVIIGNVCRSNGFHGIQMGDSLTIADSNIGLVVNGNICELNTNMGIFAKFSSNSTVTGNICRDNGISGIYLDQTVRVSVVGNNCYDTRAGGARTQVAGIHVVAQTAANDILDCDISSNICYNNLNYGALITTSGSGTIVGIGISANTCNGNGTTGIFMAEASAGNVSRARVVGNTAINNTTSDMRIDPLDVVFANNLYATLSGANTTGAYTFTNADTSPSVKGRKNFICTNSGGTTITMFDDGFPGQDISILFTDSNTTLTDGGNLKLAGAFTSTADDVMCLRFNGTNWYETSRSIN